MHHIQREILNLLIHAPALTYAQLRPKGIESNHFAYHLDQLVRAGQITKQERQYTLTPQGLTLADRLSHELLEVRKQPSIITSIHITNTKGRMLLFRHAFQPYMNHIGAPQGRLHYHENIDQAAERELYEKTGLQGIQLAHRGVVYINATKDGHVISRLVAHIFTGTVQGEPKPVSQTPTRGTSYWGAPTQKSRSKFMPGFWQVKKLLTESNDLFFAELTDELN